MNMVEFRNSRSYSDIQDGSYCNAYQEGYRRNAKADSCHLGKAPVKREGLCCGRPDHNTLCPQYLPGAFPACWPLPYSRGHYETPVRLSQSGRELLQRSVPLRSLPEGSQPAIAFFRNCRMHLPRHRPVLLLHFLLVKETGIPEYIYRF